MPRRFIEPNWKALRRLPDDLQRAWFYMWDKCDKAGVFHYDPDYMQLDLKLAEIIPIESLALCPECEILPGGERILIKNFIAVEYKSLSPKQNAHLAAFRDIDKNGLYLNSALNEASIRPVDMEEEKDKEKEVHFGKSENLLGELHPAEIHNAKMKVLKADPTIRQMGLDAVIEKSFDNFFKSYPKRTDKEYCKALWLRLKPSEIDKVFEVLPVHVEFYTGKEWSHIPSPKSWLEGKKWNDELKIEKNGKSTNSGGNGQRVQAGAGGGIRSASATGGAGKL